ncbi:HD domain-containing protein [Thermoleophilia bacterium SCSIO 60948]|nr:HD domain-containing protein [Thermoleophilia bacterium SCSIO 60948]
MGSAAVLLAFAIDGFGLVSLDDDGTLAQIEARRRLWPWALIIFVSALAVALLGWRDRRSSDRTLRSERSRRHVSERLGRRLRDEVGDLRRKAINWSSDDDISNLILSLAMELLGADKGVIFERRGGSGDRILTSAVGFRADPRDSAIVNRFATEALRADEIVVETEPEVAGDGEGGRSDREVRNVVALPIFLRDELNGVVVCANVDDPEAIDEEVLLALGDQARAVLQNSELESQMRDAHVQTVRMLVEAIRAKDPHLGGHSEEVSAYVSRVADELGFDSARRERLLFASLLHDIGKIGISERILLKPGRLSPEEFGMIEQHPRIGSRLVERVPSLVELSDLILHHHERFDGEGYPAGLKGEEIPLESRVIGVADAFSAMTSDRPYRGRLSLTEACEELERCAGSQFDPRVVEAFVAEVRERPPAGPVDSSPVVPDPGPLGADAALLGDPLELTDSLTLLYTHRYFHEHVAQLTGRARAERGFAVLLVRVGGLAEINATEGYAAGDRALQSAARVVEDVAVRYGGTAARYGGARFALAIEAETSEPATVAAVDLVDLAPAILGLEVQSAVWQPGMGPDAVIASARAAAPEPPPVAERPV